LSLPSPGESREFEPRGAHLPDGPGGMTPSPRTTRSGGAVERGRRTLESERVRRAGSRTVLVADDNIETREVMAHWLRRAGFGVVEVTDAAELIARASERPDVVVLDERLPELNGLEIANRLKSDPATSAIPIIHVASGFTTGEWRAQSLEAGADSFLTHPVEPSELIATVRALLRVRAAEEEVRTAVSSTVAASSVAVTMRPTSSSPNSTGGTGRGASTRSSRRHRAGRPTSPAKCSRRTNLCNTTRT
jgi:CheY-like chemotaxis protein